MFSKYSLEKEVYLKEDSYCYLTQIDTIIFDIDGVLVDVKLSYHKTIRDTVQYYFKNIVKMPLMEIDLVDSTILMNFKMVGGFNDDWELCAAIILFYLWKSEEYQLQSARELKDKPPLISDFVKQYLSDGGGLPKMIDWIRGNSDYADQIFSLWNKEIIFQLAKECYAGQKHCFNFYHFQPSIIKKQEGNIEQESILFEATLEDRLRKFQVGIYTGRNRGETSYIVGKIGWKRWLSPKMIVTREDNIKKPSPAGLKLLLDKNFSRRGLYIGDTRDDLLTVQNLNRKEKRIRCLSAIVTGEYSAEKREKERFYRDKEADLVAGNVNQVLRLVFSLAEWSRKQKESMGGETFGKQNCSGK